MFYIRLSKVCIQCWFAMLMMPETILQDTSAAVIIEAIQTSTNGSFVADLGCDGDMDTFSLTKDGENQSWSATLDKPYGVAWVFVRIKPGAFRLSIGLHTARPSTCVDIQKPIEETLSYIEEIFACTDTYKIGNKVKISKTDEGALKIYEIKIMEISQLDDSMYENYTNFPAKSGALDNNLNTFHHIDVDSGAVWFLRLSLVYTIKWILISIRGGNYEIHITTDDTLISASTLCKEFRFPGIGQHQITIECEKALRGNIINVRKMDIGSLRLFELYPIICPSNRYGPACIKCPKKCRTCDSVTGKCGQCSVSFYGDNCQYSCPQHCLDLVCDQTTGICNGCKEGHEGKHCELEIASLSTSVPQTYKSSRYCHNSCVTCNRDLDVCMLCDQHLQTDVCQYTCREICAGDTSCHGIQENCTSKKGGSSVITNCTISKHFPSNLSLFQWWTGPYKRINPSIRTRKYTGSPWMGAVFIGRGVLG